MKSRTIIHWGLLSTARINRRLIPAIKKSKNSQLLAVASRTLDHAVEFAKIWDIQRTYASYDALLADPEIDVIYNPLPNSLHAEWAIKAVQAGKHVLCEKPLAINQNEVDAMQAASRLTGKIITEALMYRHHPQTQQVKEILDSGAIGKLHLVRGAFSYTASRANDVRMEPELGGGCLWDVGCYPISYTRTMIGMEPDEVFGYQTLSPQGVDVHFIGQMRFPGDIFAQFQSSFVTPYQTFMEFTGSEGTLSVPNPFVPGRNQKMILKRGDQKQIIRTRGGDLYLGEVVDLENSILFGTPSRVSLKDSRNNIAVILALIESARSSKPICPINQ